MWKEWINFVLAIIVIAMAAYGAGVGRVITGVVLIAILALWAGIEELPEGGRPVSHAH